MTQPDLQTHEMQACLDYEPLSIHWAFADLVHNHTDEGWVQTTATITCEEWTSD